MNIKLFCEARGPLERFWEWFPVDKEIACYDAELDPGYRHYSRIDHQPLELVHITLFEI